MNKLGELTLTGLLRLRERWENAELNEKDKDKSDARRAKIINVIDSHIVARQTVHYRCALPKKKQRKMGILPLVGLR